MWTDKKSNMKHLKVFGSKTMVNVLREKQEECKELSDIKEERVVNEQQNLSNNNNSSDINANNIEYSDSSENENANSSSTEFESATDSDKAEEGQIVLRRSKRTAGNQGGYNFFVSDVVSDDSQTLEEAISSDYADD
ncbi:unnamed protein product [Ceratitis capitata]|uniref:(Mediterranean fruit fly) hypothetical protein n=1 Tax=Ceratitis capitata TaxID=7213 RepID=A0A811UWX3_CERCA|nr:unnamed protein product [Ceratitis capitata]